MGLLQAFQAKNWTLQARSALFHQAEKTFLRLAKGMKIAHEHYAGSMGGAKKFLTARYSRLGGQARSERPFVSENFPALPLFEER